MGSKLASTCYWVFKVVAKQTYPVAIIGGQVTAGLPPIVRFTINFIWSKALIMPLTIIIELVLSYKQKNFSVKMEQLVVQKKITSITELPGSKFLLPTFLTGGNWDF